MTAARRLTDFESTVTKDNLKMPLDQEDAKKVARMFYRRKIMQITAANIASTILDIAEGKGRVVDARVMSKTAGAVGESMTIDVLKNGTTIFTTKPIVPASGTARTWYHGVLKTDGTAEFVLGDDLTYTFTYVAGGSPTPLVDTMLIVEIEYEDGKSH